MNIRLYINYDLSLRGDYKGIYKWLDKNEAKERGNGYALIENYNIPESVISKSKDIDKDATIIKYIREDLQESVDIKPSDRIYLTFKKLEDEKLAGIFLFGKPQMPPWEGTYNESSEAVIDFDL